METVADPLNLQKAYRRVNPNAGRRGVDDMEVSERRECLKRTNNPCGFNYKKAFTFRKPLALLPFQSNKEAIDN